MPRAEEEALAQMKKKPDDFTAQRRTA